MAGCFIARIRVDDSPILLLLLLPLFIIYLLLRLGRKEVEGSQSLLGDCEDGKTPDNVEAI